MHERPVFSFCMLTWNRAPMLRGCIRSFLDQISHAIPYELIVMDNASTDETESVLKEFESHSNIRIVRNGKNLRLNAYKPLFGLARGQYIVDLDDDILEFPKDFDRTFLEYFNAFPDYGFLCLNVVQNDKTTGHKPGPECYREDRRGDRVVEEGPVGGWCAAFRRRHYRLFRFFFNRMNLSISRVEDGVLSGFIHVVLRKRQGVIREAVCLHATGPYYAEQFGLLQREREKYNAAGLPDAANEFRERASPESI
jgi:glycosyltransferase involved in cell wall biosynthesis